ncbi:MAG: TonB-dependent receptor plug domain-containing protein [Chitinophagales bacterium]|nr:TonB-dependent receptor plug domain-containing protein [Chitinophagales bacterium]
MLALVLISNALLAQSRRVSGTVADADGPLTGATVALKGTTTGAVTDLDGKFTLEVSGANPVLVVSYTGYTTVEVGIGTQSSMSILLESSSIALEELIVSGYTVETRKQATSAVATVKTRDLAAVPTGNVEQQLQGRVSGLTVISNGQPGTTSQVRIRGFGSFFGNQPLFIVDGVPTQNIDFLAPDDIDNTTVMKDASSASIYGARAAGGVIAITTKRGANKPQRMQVSYDALVGWTDPGQGVEVLNPQDQATWTWTALRNAGLATEHPQYGNGASPTLPDFINVGGLSGLNASQVNLEQEKAKYNVNTDNGPIYQIVRANKEGTDWYGAITRTAPMTRHNLGFRGSTESSRYYIGLSVQNQSGILIHNDFKRYTLRANTEFDVFKKFRIGQNMQVTYRSVLGGLGGGGGVNVAQDENPILGSFRMPTIIPVYDELGGYAGTAAKGFNNPRNPLQNAMALRTTAAPVSVFSVTSTLNTTCSRALPCAAALEATTATTAALVTPVAATKTRKTTPALVTTSFMATTTPGYGPIRFSTKNVLALPTLKPCWVRKLLPTAAAVVSMHPVWIPSLKIRTT